MITDYFSTYHHSRQLVSAAWSLKNRIHLDSRAWTRGGGGDLGGGGDDVGGGGDLGGGGGGGDLGADGSSHNDDVDVETGGDV